MAAHNQRMAERIRLERQRRGLSEAELAWKVGASERQVRRWEGAESEPRPANLRALATFFELEVEDIRPDLEAEERAVVDQLNRIEAKLDALLGIVGTTPPAADDAELDQAARELEQDDRERQQGSADEEQGPRRADPA